MKLKLWLYVYWKIFLSLFRKKKLTKQQYDRQWMTLYQRSGTVDE